MWVGGCVCVDYALCLYLVISNLFCRLCFTKEGTAVYVDTESHQVRHGQQRDKENKNEKQTTN